MQKILCQYCNWTMMSLCLPNLPSNTHCSTLFSFFLVTFQTYHMTFESFKVLRTHVQLDSHSGTKRNSSTLTQKFNLIFNPKVSSPITHRHHYSLSTVKEFRHVFSFLFDFFPPPSTPTCFLGFPEPVRNAEKQGEVLYLHFFLPASHWLTSNVPQVGRYKI